MSLKVLCGALLLSLSFVAGATQVNEKDVTTGDLHSAKRIGWCTMVMSWSINNNSILEAMNRAYDTKIVPMNIQAWYLFGRNEAWAKLRKGEVSQKQFEDKCYNPLGNMLHDNGEEQRRRAESAREHAKELEKASLEFEEAVKALKK